MVVARQEEEEWQEVLAQQDTCQQPAAPLQTPAEAPGNPGDGPANSLAPGTASNAQAATSAANAGRDSRVEGEQAEMTDALVPAGIEQAEVAAVRPQDADVGSQRSVLCLLQAGLHASALRYAHSCFNAFSIADANLSGLQHWVLSVSARYTISPGKHTAIAPVILLVILSPAVVLAGAVCPPCLVMSVTLVSSRHCRRLTSAAAHCSRGQGC